MEEGGRERGAASRELGWSWAGGEGGAGRGGGRTSSSLTNFSKTSTGGSRLSISGSYSGKLDTARSNIAAIAPGGTEGSTVGGGQRFL